MTSQQISAVRAIADAILEGIRAAGDHGAPEGVLYASLAGHLSLTQFQSIVRGMERAGWVKRDGFLLHYVPRTEENVKASLAAAGGAS